MRPATSQPTDPTIGHPVDRRVDSGAQPHVHWNSPVQYLRGVGPRRAEAFAALSVETVGDLIEYFPFRHEHRPRSCGIGYAVPGQPATVIGELRQVRTSGRPGNSVISAYVIDGTGRARVRWFNSSYLADKLRYGLIVRLSGRAEMLSQGIGFTNPQLQILETGDDPTADDCERFEPVYPASADLPSREIAKIILHALDAASDGIDEFLPADLRSRRGLPDRRFAVCQMHRPMSPADLELARRRLVYEEFLVLQIAFQLSRRRRAGGTTTRPIDTTERIDSRIRRRLPFALTAGQNRAVAEIMSDMARPTPMNRLLQADVGAGKTAVAVYAALATIADRRQVALLAPTEVLAAQHMKKIDQYLSGSRVRTAQLTGSLCRAKRKEMLSALARGGLDLVVGTHALLETDVQFHDLGLVIVDEQHKFGVAQRAALRAKGANPHTLVLTATPIPRTLAMTLFGDLDVSVIEGTLPGRHPIETRLIARGETEAAWRFVRSRLLSEEQAYVVYPLIDESEDLPLKAAAAEAKRLQATVLCGIPIGLLHGRMKPAEKTEVMERFRRGEVRVLVATTVIEVGIDVPTATIMAIQHAERYGLSQLHQLRGRVGRGGRRSWCLLFAESAAEEARTRLELLCHCQDGFRIAEADLQMRGPGELMGTRQHGLPALKVADPMRDIVLLEQARDDAAALLGDASARGVRAHAPLLREVSRRYGTAMELADTG